MKYIIKIGKECYFSGKISGDEKGTIAHTTALFNAFRFNKRGFAECVSTTLKEFCDNVKSTEIVEIDDIKYILQPYGTMSFSLAVAFVERFRNRIEQVKNFDIFVGWGEEAREVVVAVKRNKRSLRINVYYKDEF